MEKFAAIVAVCLAACAAPAAAPGSRYEIAEQAIDAELDAWESRMGALATCRTERQSIDLAQLPALPEWCPADARACMRTQRGYVTIAWDERPTIAHVFEALIRHEATHWLIHCSGTRADVDPEHTLPVW